MNLRKAQGWEVVLADLALILFLVTLSALARDHPAAKSSKQPVAVTPALALFRPDGTGPTLAEWLNDQPFDQRATLTVFGQHTGENEPEVWDQAQALAKIASGKGFAVRVVITKGQKQDVYASLAYDVAADAT